MITRTASARYEGLGKDGKGHVSTQSGVLSDQPYGFTVTRSDLSLEARIAGIDAERFAAIAADAKANCPISKLLNAEITLEHRLAAA